METGFAPAKLNLTLHVTGRRPDGYHLLDSLVIFADCGDRVSLRRGPGLTLKVSGPFASMVPLADNLVLRAARAAGISGALHLDKWLPPASGMGGGTSDAAATLRLGGQALDVPAMMGLGADLPVCMAAPQPCRMRGLGECVTPVDGVPPLALVLVNPGVELSTPEVFRALENRENPPMPDQLPRWRDAADLAGWLRPMRNDLQDPALRLRPQIAGLLAEIESQPGCLIARMTGSGATCFGIFGTAGQARSAAAAMDAPGHWVQACGSLMPQVARTTT